MAGKKITQGIDVDRLDRIVEDLGVRIHLYKSTLIPSMKSLESMDQDLNESISNHNMLDFDCIETIALFQQQTLMKQFELTGTYDIDEVLITFKSGQTLAPLSKIEVLDFREDFYELIPRQEGTSTDLLKYPACNIIGAFSMPSSNTIERFYQDTDFEIDKNGNINWIGTHKPNDRQIYSIYYKYHPVYRAIKAVHRDRFSQYNMRPASIKAPKKTIDFKTFVKLPETWVIKRDYLLDRRDINGNLLVKNTNYDPNE